MKTIYSLYKITNTLNQKVYIGYTKGKVERRFKRHIYESKNPTSLLHKSLLHHGSNKFSIETIYQSFDHSHIQEMEKYFIKVYESYYAFGKGYNMTFGGDGGATFTGKKHTKESLLKKSISAKLNHQKYPRTHSQETKEKIKNSLLGRKQSQSQKDKVSIALKGRPKPKITCPNCGKSGQASNMKRYHFDNCRSLAPNIL